MRFHKEVSCSRNMCTYSMAKPKTRTGRYERTDANADAHAYILHTYINSEYKCHYYYYCSLHWLWTVKLALNKLFLFYPIVHRHFAVTVCAQAFSFHFSLCSLCSLFLGMRFLFCFWFAIFFHLSRQFYPILSIFFLHLQHYFIVLLLVP